MGALPGSNGVPMLTKPPQWCQPHLTQRNRGSQSPCQLVWPGSGLGVPGLGM